MAAVDLREAAVGDAAKKHARMAHGCGDVQRAPHHQCRGGDRRELLADVDIPVEGHLPGAVRAVAYALDERLELAFILCIEEWLAVIHERGEFGDRLMPALVQTAPDGVAQTLLVVGFYPASGQRERGHRGAVLRRVQRRDHGAE